MRTNENKTTSESSLAKDGMVANLLKKASSEEPRVVSFDLESFLPETVLAYAGNTYV